MLIYSPFSEHAVRAGIAASAKSAVLYPASRGSLLAAPLHPGVILYLPAAPVSLQPKSDHSHSGTAGRGKSGQCW